MWAQRGASVPKSPLSQFAHSDVASFATAQPQGPRPYLPPGRGFLWGQDSRRCCRQLRRPHLFRTSFANSIRYCRHQLRCRLTIRSSVCVSALAWNPSLVDSPMGTSLHRTYSQIVNHVFWIPRTPPGRARDSPKRRRQIGRHFYPADQTRTSGLARLSKRRSGRLNDLRM
jgi:hypothetical protein